MLPFVQRERNQRLRGRLDLLIGENEELHMKVADLKASTFAHIGIRLASLAGKCGSFCAQLMH